MSAIKAVCYYHYYTIVVLFRFAERNKTTNGGMSAMEAVFRTIITPVVVLLRCAERNGARSVGEVFFCYDFETLSVMLSFHGRHIWSDTLWDDCNRGGHLVPLCHHLLYCSVLQHKLEQHIMGYVQ